MKKISEPEYQRLEAQKKCDDAKTALERNKLGQFATPTNLANDIMAYARTLLTQETRVRFLDPAIGTGSFYSALLENFGSKDIAYSKGYEIDAHYATPAKEIWKNHPLQIEVTDFTKKESGDDNFNLIISNPPYVRHHHITQDDKKRMGGIINKKLSFSVSGLSGLYCYFLLLAHQWLSADGISGWLIPSEFMDVNYGATIKKYLLTEVELLHIHRFDPKEPQFGDAIVSSAIVWFRKRKVPASHRVRFTFGGTLLNPKISSFVEKKTLMEEKKWSRFPQQAVREQDTSPKIGDFFSIKRGVVTGDNKFFIKTREEIRELGLPLEMFRPILPPPRKLAVDEVEADGDGFPKLDSQSFLLNCAFPEQYIKQRYPKLWEYLQSGAESVSKGYICGGRMPWYSQESRSPAQFICTYMGRGSGENKRPFRFILNWSNAIAANTYLLIYPKEPLRQILQGDKELTRKIWCFFNEITTDSLISEGRVYGGGLYKMEPSELANVPAGDIADMVSSAITSESNKITLPERTFQTHLF